MPLNPCDLVELAAEAKRKAKGAHDLERFVQSINKRYGAELRPEVADALLKKASERYTEDYRSLEDIKAEMTRVVVAEARHGMSVREAWKTFRETGNLKHVEPGRLALGLVEKAADAAFLLPRTLMTTGDQSMPGRQAWLANIGHPIDAIRSMPHQNRAMYGEKGLTNLGSRFQDLNFFKKNERRVGMSGEQYARYIDESIKGRENYPLYKESGLEIIPLDPTGNPFEHEEAFQSSLSHKIPVAKTVVRASERAAITHMNMRRADLFDQMLDFAQRHNKGEAIDLKEAKEIANTVNTLTGRGALPEKIKSGGALLSSIYFAPRLVASRLRFLTGALESGAKAAVKGVGGDILGLTEGMTGTEKAIGIEYMRTMGAMAAVIGTLKAAGADVELDPRSSRFLQIRWGKVHIDVSGGLRQYITLLSRLATQSTMDKNGRIVKLGQPGFGKPTEGTVLERFSRGKASPPIGILVDRATEKKIPKYNAPTTPWYDKQIGTDFVGRPTTISSHAERSYVPLHVSGTAQTLQEGEGAWKALVGAALEYYGIGVNTYDEHASKQTMNTPDTPIRDVVSNPSRFLQSH